MSSGSPSHAASRLIDDDGRGDAPLPSAAFASSPWGKGGRQQQQEHQHSGEGRRRTGAKGEAYFHRHSCLPTTTAAEWEGNNTINGDDDDLGCDDDGTTAPPPPLRLPWWKRVLLDPAYRARLTELATVCYRQELHLLEEHPFLISSSAFNEAGLTPPKVPCTPQEDAATRGCHATATPSAPRGAKARAAAALTAMSPHAQFMCIPGKGGSGSGGAVAPASASPAHDGVVASGGGGGPPLRVWDCRRREWTEECLEAVYAGQNFGLPGGGGGRAEEDGDGGAFSLLHPRSVMRHSGIASRQRAHQSQQATRTTTTAAATAGDENVVYCSPAAQRVFRLRGPSSPSGVDKHNSDDDDDECRRHRLARIAAAARRPYHDYSNGIDGVRLLQSRLAGGDYAAYHDESHFTRIAEEQRQQQQGEEGRALRAQLLSNRNQQRHQRQVGGSRSGRGYVGASAAASSSQSARTATTAATAHEQQQQQRRRVAAGASTWAAPPRTAAEIELDKLLGLAHSWRGVLPPSGFVRVAPDPRRAMWQPAFAADEARRAARLPEMRRGPTRTQLLEDPTGEFNAAIAGAFDSPLCIHIFRAAKENKNEQQQQPVVESQPRPGKQSTASNSSNPSAGYEYVGTYRQSLLLVHVKIFFRALHEEQRQRARAVVAAAAPVPNNRNGGSGAAATANGSVNAVSSSPAEADVACSAWVCEALGSLQTEANAAEGSAPTPPPTPSPSPPAVVTVKEQQQQQAARVAAAAAAVAAASRCPVLLYGVPEVPFPVLRVAATAADLTHDPVASTSILAINRHAALVKSSSSSRRVGGGVGRAGVAHNGNNAKATASAAAYTGATTIASTLNNSSNIENPLASAGMWMGLAATPGSQPARQALAATRLWRQLHYHSRRARNALKAVFYSLKCDKDGCLGKAAYVRFVLDLLRMFFPTHLSGDGGGGGGGGGGVHVDIAEEEWVYRGTTENLPFATFFERFFPFPFIFIRDLATVTERDYIEFWELVRLALFKDTRAVLAAAEAEASMVGGVSTTTAITAMSAMLVRVAARTAASPPSPSSPAHRSAAAGSPLEVSRSDSVLYELRLSRDLGSTAINNVNAHNHHHHQQQHLPLADLTPAQVQLLLCTDYTHSGATAARDKKNTSRKGGNGAATTVCTVTAAVAVSGAATNGLSVTFPSSTVHGSMPTTNVTGGGGGNNNANIDVLDDPSDPRVLARLARGSTHYRRRHNRQKVDYLNRVAHLSAIDSAWAVHWAELYDRDGSGGRPVSPTVAVLAGRLAGIEAEHEEHSRRIAAADARALAAVDVAGIVAGVLERTRTAREREVASDDDDDVKVGGHSVTGKTARRDVSVASSRPPPSSSPSLPPPPPPQSQKRHGPLAYSRAYALELGRQRSHPHLQLPHCNGGASSLLAPSSSSACGNVSSSLSSAAVALAKHHGSTGSSSSESTCGIGGAAATNRPVAAPAALATGTPAGKHRSTISACIAAAVSASSTSSNSVNGFCPSVRGQTEGLSPQQQQHRPSPPTASPTAAAAAVHGDEDADVDRLISYLADIPDEVFDENRVSIRERFQTHEGYESERQRLRREHALL